MTSIIYVGMDVHTTNYTLCCYSIQRVIKPHIGNRQPSCMSCEMKSMLAIHFHRKNTLHNVCRGSRNSIMGSTIRYL